MINIFDLYTDYLQVSLGLAQPLRVPIAFNIIRKPEFSCDIKSKKIKRKSHVTKQIIGDRNKGYQNNINKLELQPWTPTKVWLKDVELEIFLIKQVFKNKDDSTGVRYLASN